LKQDYKSSEFKVVDTKAEKAPVAFTSEDIKKFGAVGAQIGQINKEISGKTKEEAFEIIKIILGNPELKMESKKWIKTFEGFRNSKQEELFESQESWEKKFIVWANKQTNKELALSLMDRFYQVRDYRYIPDVKREAGRLAGQSLPGGDFNSYESAEQMEKRLEEVEKSVGRDQSFRGARERMFTRTRY
jgi:hypothetical protein